GLVNGAGWDQIQPFLENPPEMWDRIIAINLMGAVRLTRGLLPPMVAASAGNIVNISSDAGRGGSMGGTVYAAARGGVTPFPKLSRAGPRAPPHQRQLRVPRPARHATVSASARAYEGGADPGHPVSPDRAADRNRRGGHVLFERPVRLHHRTSAECQRRLDDG